MSWLENLSVDAVCGDLFALDVEAIVCTIKVDGTLYGRTSKQLYHLGEPNLRNQVKGKLLELGVNSLALGEAISVDTRNLPELKMFSRVILAALWDYQSEYTSNLIYAVIINSLRQAFAGTVKSLAIPILNVDEKMFAQTTLKVLTELDTLRNSSDFSVDELLFVSNKENRVNYLNKAISQL